jgi:hypothetical protein
MPWCIQLIAGGKWVEPHMKINVADVMMMMAMTVM